MEVKLSKTSRPFQYEVKQNNVLIDLLDPQILNPRFSITYSPRILTVKDLNRSDNGEYSMLDSFGLRRTTNYFYLSIEGE